MSLKAEVWVDHYPHFEPPGDDSQRYAFVAAVVKRLRYGRLPRSDKGVVMHYLERTTGYSRARLKRLVCRVRAGETLAKHYAAPEQGFARKFTTADVALLAETDALHGTLSGPATKCLCERAVEVFGDTRYGRLAGISVAHLYNLLPKRGDMRSSGDTRDDQDGVKGLCHINTVDGVTQFETVALRFVRCGQLTKGLYLLDRAHAGRT